MFGMVVLYSLTLVMDGERLKAHLHQLLLAHGRSLRVDDVPCLAHTHTHKEVRKSRCEDDIG